jgi:hypothetical protein
MAVVHRSAVCEFIEDALEHRMDAELALVRLRRAVMDHQPRGFVDALHIAEVALSQMGVALVAARRTTWQGAA